MLATLVAMTLTSFKADGKSELFHLIKAHFLMSMGVCLHEVEHPL